MTLGPAPVLALVLGLVHTSLYVLVRGTADGRLPLLLGVAFVGAWVGDAVGARVGVDLVRIGDFHLVWASVLAWLGLVVVGIAGVLAPDRKEERAP